MAVLEGDIKLLKSERLDDTDDGGGRMTGAEVVDGVSNNLFPDISELDRTVGRINLRKCFPAVLTLNTDTLYGAHVILEDAPDDPAVSATLFSTADWFDNRAAARNRVESYLAPGGRWPGYPYETQIEGVGAIQIWQRPEAPLPEIGNVYVLFENEGQPSEYSQYVRITSLTETLQTFTASNGSEFVRRIVTAEISDPLRHTFHGPAVSNYDPTAPAAIVRQTIVADASRYFGIQPLTDPITAGAFVAQVASIYTQLVPSATAEVAVVDANPNAENATLVPAASGTVTFGSSATWSAGLSVYLGTACRPGTLSVSGGATLTDTNGTIHSGATPVGTIDYAEGIITFGVGSPTFGGAKTVSFAPAGPLIGPMQTARIAVTLPNRGLVYTLTLPVLPKPGTLRVAYRAQGKWYVLTDSGDGTLSGQDSSFGAGTVRFDTGSTVVTLGALPDIGSAILYSWGIGGYSFNRGGSAIPKGFFELTTVAAINPGGLTLAWNDGGARTASDDGEGNLSGDATGLVDYGARRIVFRPNTLPAPGTEVTATITPISATQEIFNAPVRDGSGNINLTLAHTGIVARSVRVAITGNHAPPAQTFYPPTPPLMVGYAAGA